MDLIAAVQKARNPDHIGGIDTRQKQTTEYLEDFIRLRTIKGQYQNTVLQDIFNPSAEAMDAVFDHQRAEAKKSIPEENYAFQLAALRATSIITQIENNSAIWHFTDQEIELAKLVVEKKSLGAIVENFETELTRAAKQIKTPTLVYDFKNWVKERTYSNAPQIEQLLELAVIACYLQEVTRADRAARLENMNTPKDLG